ncbi:MAG: hypothetical protein PUI40_11250 [Oscillospiraceae bacterium]|nr:hypothetical protein [Oscillospiraceae bacterium]
MEITTDVSLKGTAWSTAIEKLAPIFKTRTNFSIFMFSLAIGVMYDKRIEKPEGSDDDAKSPPSVPRNVIQNNDNGRLDFIFQAAILSTTTEAFEEKDRLELAFGERSDFKKIDFLTQFANFGVTKLVELVGDTTLESMENIKNFAASTVEGRNLDIDDLPDEILIDEDF